MSVSTHGRTTRSVRSERTVSRRPSREFYVAGLISLALLVGILVTEFAIKELFVSGFVLLAILAAGIGFFAAGRAADTQRS
jgi:hypothetical protein